MPQINDIRELAQQNARYVSNSPQDWMSYLDVAARLYRYSFTDTLLIHAQRPDATACAELELWNQKMSRWVNRGAKGIALLDDTGPRTKLRYVFDIADTHLVRGGKTPLLWNLDSHEHEQAILDHLADTYGLSQTDSMNTALMELAQQLTADNLDEAMDGLAYEVADTFLKELDEDNIRVRFRELMTNSIFYTLSRRCGQEPMDVLDDDDFIRIVDFNKLPVLSFLGNAVSEQCEAVLFDIGREMRKIYKKEITQQLEKSVDSLYNTNTDFSTLKRETGENTTKGGQENGVDVLPQGRLSVPESGREGRAADHREVRDAAQDVPEREPKELVSEYADERQTEPASGADRGSSGESGGNPAGQPEREVSGTEQGERPAGMGGTSEQPDGDGRRDRLEGIGVQLTETTTEQDLSEAEEEIASAFSFPDLPTVEQQIRAIEAPTQARYADEIALDPEVVDEILRTGSNRSKGQLRLIYNFMVEKTPEEYTEFVKNEYGTGGKGFEIDGAKYAVWFDDLGLRIAVGSTAKGGTLANAFLSWEDVSNRIHELLRQGGYAPQAVLDAARQNALQEHAQTLAYMERDLADGVAEAVFQDAEIFRGGFPELTDRLADLLDDAAFLIDLNERLSALGEVYAEDKDLMRMHFYKPDKVAVLFQQFAKPYQNYAAREGFHWNEYKKFITEDEINAYFTRGSNYSDSRLAIYSFFLNHEDKKERADFLKDHYGIGGSSHALCGADDSHEDHDGRGIALERGPYGNPDASVHLNWNQAAGRIDRLIRDSEYLKPADYSRMPAYEQEKMAMRVMSFYHHMPSEVERPYPQDLYHEEGRKALVEKLADPEQAVELLEQMDNVLQCRNGIDTIVEDYKTVPGWNNPYIQNHVVQPLQGALAVQDVELAYELPDAYFHIQTCDDGFDYTLYNKDFTERDGGILETDGDKSVQDAMTELLAEFGCDAAQGRVMDAAELREQADMVAEQQAEVLKEKLAAERPVPEETLSFYVAECLEFTFAGEFHDHLTMKEALEAYDKIPSERMNADKCIGFCIEEDGGFVGMYELVVNDKVQRENINSINYFRDDKLVQQAISDMEKLMAARQQSKEQERGSTKKSVLDALRSLKAKKQEQPAQEQDKPKKAKKKGMEL